MVPVPDQFHHRNTTKASNKPFKSRHATKGAIKDRVKGKVEDWKKERKTPHQQLMSKLDRRNQARQKQQVKYQEKAKATSIFAGKQGAPRYVAIVPLTEDANPHEAIWKLNSSVDLEDRVQDEEFVRARVDRFKQNIIYVPAQRDLFSALDACRIADYVIFIMSAKQEVDELGETFLRSIEGQGVSNAVAVVQGLDSIEPAKKRTPVVSSLKSFITHFFPTLEKVYSLDARQECSNVMRSLCSSMPKGIKWREDRSWMFIEDIQWPAEQTGANQKGDVIVTGVVRGKSLKADRLVQVGDWGDFQISKILTAPLVKLPRVGNDNMAIDEEKEEILDQPTDDRDDLEELAREEIMMEDVDDVSMAQTERKGVLLDDHHYFSDDDGDQVVAAPVSKKLPRGTSSYQAAWYIDDVSDSGSEVDETEDMDGDISMDATAHPEDGIEGLVAPPTEAAMTEAAPSEYPQSEMFLDPTPDDEAEQIASYRAKRKDADDDLEFPDEIELHPNVLARERLARYRGLKSLRTSTWETDEDRAHEPECWRRLLQIMDYKGARNHAMNEALVGGAKAGSRVSVHLINVPLTLRSSPKPTALFSLLRHEHKRTVTNFSVTLDAEYPSPIKSKMELLMQCGPRRMLVNPLFSQSGTTPNDVHKFDRYLHPGRTAIASFIAPLTWGSVPTLFFNPSSSSLIGTGTSLPPSTSRVVAKRCILTGHPYKINKKVVTIRYMFFNTEDVNWFKALPLWTRRGRSGFIKESLGTHGYFKATFDGRINPMDAVGVSLYKRVFPRWSKAWSKEEEEIPTLMEAV
ncbi:MAG: ribosome biogenesis protein tsr1 [Cirrosporium novae-zelandiae]|nr:MAG: ribosome biogenesis protein tsr1 [Cirrosporium novae-zelandiae]